jgi:hypothetical protein
MSTKTTAEKLLIKPNTTIWSSHAERLPLLGPLPEGVGQAGDLAGATLALVFADSAAGLREILEPRRGELATPGVFWVLYPKGGRADINRDSLWPILTEYNMRPIGQVAVDGTWSALRFRPIKEGEAPFSGGAG